MKITKFFYTDKFRKSLNKFPKNDQKKIKEKIDLFLSDPFHPTLKTHKLIGKLQNYHSFSLKYNLRVLFHFVSVQIVEFIDVGTHSIYK